jgi:hypothetical protein
MTLLTIFIRILEGMFVAGGIGSCLVLILTGIEDIETLLGSDSKEPPKEAPAN